MNDQHLDGTRWHQEESAVVRTPRPTRISAGSRAVLVHVPHDASDGDKDRAFKLITAALAARSGTLSEPSPSDVIPGLPPGFRLEADH